LKKVGEKRRSVKEVYNRESKAANLELKKGLLTCGEGEDRKKRLGDT